MKNAPSLELGALFSLGQPEDPFRNVSCPLTFNLYCSLCLCSHGAHLRA